MAKAAKNDAARLEAENEALKAQIAELRRELRTYRETLDNVGAYIFAKDRQGCYTFANRPVRELFGHELADIVGFDDRHFFSLELSDQLARNDRQVMHCAETVEGEEHNVIAETGETRIYWSVKKPLYDDDRSVTGMFGVSTDITHQKQLEYRLREEQYLLNTVLQNCGACIYMKDRELRYLYVNRPVEELYGLSNAEIVGKLDSEIFPPDIAQALADMDAHVLAAGEADERAEDIVDTYGRRRRYHSRKVPLTDDNGVVTALIGFSYDMTKRIELEEELARMARTDWLTGLANRRYIRDVLEAELARAQRHSRPFAVLILDLDHFKAVNDSYGHGAGDAVLARAAEVLGDRLRASDTVGRFGGEEFLVLLPETDLTAARTMAEDVRGAIAAMRVTADKATGQALSVTCSIGVAAFDPGDPTDLENLIQQADDNSYAAKQAGSDRVVA